MYKFLIFGGTTEGRVITEELAKYVVQLHVSVATDYGKSLLKDDELVTISAQRLTKEQMSKLMITEDYDAVIDATHPYAIEVTANIIEACKDSGKKYIRLLRKPQEYNSPSLVYVESIAEAVEYLNTVEGNILLTTGSKDLKSFVQVNNYKERIFPRILPMVNVLQDAFDLGYLGKNIICMQGPFSEELNTATLRKVAGKFLVTKESGDIGGIEEKIRSAEEVGAKVILVKRPTNEKGQSLEEVINMIINDYKLELR